MTKNSRLAIFNTDHGLVFELGSAHGARTAGGGQNLFLTPSVDSKDGAIYASSNPEVHGAGVINFPIARGRCVALGTQLRPVHVNLYQSLQKALNRTYDWTDEGGQKQRTLYPDSLKDPSKWTLTSVYLGTEVQGSDGNATVRFSEVSVIP